jgi:hypothetical protein
MRRKGPVLPEWAGRVVAIRNRGGVQVLLGLRKCDCEHCSYGVRVETVWAGVTGEATRMSWCGTCFNADCAAIELDERQSQACRRLALELTSQPSAKIWSCARPAIADLEARGMI